MSLSLRSPRALQLAAGAAFCGVASAAYFSTKRPLQLDSSQNAASKTLSLPSTMLFSKQLTVTKVEQVNHDTKKVTFALPGGVGEISGVEAGSAILTQHTPPGAWFPVLRPYTPISDADERGTLQLLVKQYPNGQASRHIHTLTPGSKLQIRGPIPGYRYTASTQARQVLFIAGGAGITPLYSLAKKIVSDASDETRITLLWGVNGTRDLVLKAELEALEAQFPNRLSVKYCISGPEAAPGTGSLGDETKFKKGHVDKSVLQEAIERCKKGRWGDGKTKVWLCGPPAMEEAIAGQKGVLAELGVAKNEIHKF
ncbi:NADH-cytochrome b5 reductase 2 [Acrodontium crateriforme]|uniref:NADH-cytochrome b5 reductase 2 n=1 Tax=Acrodontium crateriforme TaxID=150365 RepID=A0AAQ3R8C8_9PEZI|nr:NADH-cytochrome b5 reductase 2 [Acrodontium crateriforme]